MKLYFSVVSHLHNDILIQLNTLQCLAQHPEVEVIFRDNIHTQELEQYCAEHGITYVSNEVEKGFATNNNLNYLLAQSKGLTPDDYFVLLNPDVKLTELILNKLVDFAKRDQHALMVPNLYLDEEQTVFDDNLRAYPSFSNFVRNYVLGDRSTVIDKTHPTEGQTFWGSAAFMLVKAELYQTLGGLDETYYMYCEDIDFCLRARALNQPVVFVPQIEAIHFRHRCSQQFLSRAFFRHVKSVLLYSIAKRGWRQPKTSIPPHDEFGTKLESRVSG
ncbi:glycosyltransferase family 2 protein [Vibrio astriarenae]